MLYMYVFPRHGTKLLRKGLSWTRCDDYIELMQI